MITALAALVSGAILVFVWRAPWLLVKPSFQFLIGANLLLQWPMALFGEIIFEGIESPNLVAMMVALPLLAALLWIPFHAGPATIAIRARAHIRPEDPAVLEKTARAMTLLWIPIAVVALWYLTTVPLQSTGLYVIFTNPARAALAREDSLKLLTNKELVYAYLAIGLVCCPLVCALSLRLALGAWRTRRTGLLLVALASFVLSLAIASLSGARSFPARVILIAGLSRWFESGMKISLARMLAIPAMVFVPVALLTVLREGKSVDALVLGQYMVDVALHRGGLIPAQVGVFHLRYAQDYGAFGVAAVPRLAAMAGVDPVNVPNVVGRHYFADAGPTSFANASFLFTYISYFGVIGLIVNIVLVGALEWTILALRRTGPALLGPVLAFFAVANIGYLSADYTTVLLSNGIVLAAVIAVVGTWWLHDGGSLARTTTVPIRSHPQVLESWNPEARP